MHTILITGAGTGIGKATAQLLSKNPNHRLLLVGRRLEKLEEVVATLDNSTNHIIASVDVSDKNNIVNFLNSEEADLSNHPLVNVFANAGIGGPNFWGERRQMAADYRHKPNWCVQHMYGLSPVAY